MRKPSARPPRKPWVVGVSGASGSPYAKAVITALLEAGESVDLIVSRAARLTLLDETGFTIRDAHWQIDVEKWLEREVDPEQVRYWQVTDFAAGPSSGSYPVKGMLVVPATSAACAGIARGLSKDLLQRAADVNLKEQRPVVIVSRETPLSRSHLVNQVDLHDAGALILPATPGFYAGARDVQQLVDFVAGRILDAIDVPHTLYQRWEGELGAARKPD
ncbi:UbiX family flavin prenyltransferase [Natronoglycomyces albus]|uniref:Flavin prenyltransferase UbiX n=1 Tax=Natronoglycomyces albus TaxID=2811108 RepID=A0A895XU97_9ACTN|nr:UbiX family flavin prenyltransferase [Natronoglycomyces albus]QSB05820.1 UbiX family flavin prenyltransferase [Natronoglycomyces albus]